MVKYLPVFLIKSRIRSSQLIILIILYIILGTPNAVILGAAAGLKIVIPFYPREFMISILLILLLFMFQILGNYLLIKSDLDFLVSFGLKSSRLALGFSIYALLLLSFPTLFILSITGILTKQYAPLYSIIVFYLAIVFSVVGLFILRMFSKNGRFLMFLATFIVLALLGIAKIPIGLGSISSIYWPYALIVVIIYLIALAVQIRSTLKTVSSVGINLKYWGPTNVKHVIAFEKWNGRFPIMKFQSLYSFVFLRSRMSGKSRTGLIRSTHLFAVEAIISAFIYIIWKVLPPSAGGVTFLMFFVIVYVFGFMTLIAFFSIIHERVWISLASTSPLSSSRQYIIGRLLYEVIFSSPLLILIYVAFLMHNSFLIDLAPSVIFLPIALFYPFFIFGVILNLNVIQMQFKLSYVNYNQHINLIFIPLVIAYIAILAVGILLPLVGIIACIMSYIVAAVLILSSRIMEKTFFALSSHGYV